MLPPAPTTSFGVQMPVTYGLPAPQQQAQAPVSTGLDLTQYGAPAPYPAASAAGRSLLKAPAPTVAPPADKPKPSETYSAAAPALAGLQAGQMGLGAYDTTTGVASTLGAGLAGGASGALSGAMIGAAGGPIGAVGGAAIGAGVGLVVGGLNAWMSVGRENKANRDRRKLLAEAKAEQNRRDKIARADAIDGLAFQRRELADAKRLEEWQRSRALIAEARAKKETRDAQYIEKGYV